MENSYCFFRNTECEYFPCHAGASGAQFNCLFCYCPLYALGAGCGGNFTYTAQGVKDCSGCMIPHSPKGYDYIMQRFKQIKDLAWENREHTEPTGEK